MERSCPCSLICTRCIGVTGRPSQHDDAAGGSLDTGVLDEQEPWHPARIAAGAAEFLLGESGGRFPEPAEFEVGILLPESPLPFPPSLLSLSAECLVHFCPHIIGLPGMQLGGADQGGPEPTAERAHVGG